MHCASVLGEGMEQALAQRVTIVYVQAEDDFHRVRTNYLNAMGRLTEAEGGSAIWQGLRMKLFIDPEVLPESPGPTASTPTARPTPT